MQRNDKRKEWKHPWTIKLTKDVKFTTCVISGIERIHQAEWTNEYEREVAAIINYK